MTEKQINKKTEDFVKSEREIAYIKKAVAITDEIYKEFKPLVVEGKTEKELLVVLLKMIEDSEADGPSFDPIIASGPNGAEPHHTPGDYILKEGEMVVVDFGVFFKGLASDMTRMIAIGTPNDDVLEAYEIVREAYEEATMAIENGVPSSEIDVIARDLIQWYGFGDKFIHTTGHGLGYEVHERPMLYATSKEKLMTNMVVTVEPGIYVEGKFGVRLENDILVKNSGYEVLNDSDMDY